MGIENPSEEAKASVRSAVEWFEENKIEGWDVKIINAPTLPKGKDRIIIEDKNSTIWARFYKLETNHPIFAGRDGNIHYSLTEVENERRVGYAFYGKWPEELIEKEFPEWRMQND